MKVASTTLVMCSFSGVLPRKRLFLLIFRSHPPLVGGSSTEFPLPAPCAILDPLRSDEKHLRFASRLSLSQPPPFSWTLLAFILSQRLVPSGLVTVVLLRRARQLRLPCLLRLSGKKRAAFFTTRLWCCLDRATPILQHDVAATTSLSFSEERLNISRPPS